MVKQINKTELSKLLGIKNLRRLTLEKIEEKLLKQCYVLHKVEKIGREIIYTIEYQEQDFSINDYVEDEFNVKDGGKFMEHTNERIKSIKKDIPMSAREISEKINTTRQTCYNYDKKLEEKGVISKDGYEKVYLQDQDTQPINFIISEDMLAKLRQDWIKYIQPLYKGEKCELCGSTERLEVHHINAFSRMLNESIEELGMNENNFDFELLRKYFIGKQHKEGKYITLCKCCHLYEVHGGHVVLKYKINEDNKFYKMLLGEGVI